MDELQALDQISNSNVSIMGNGTEPITGYTSMLANVENHTQYVPDMATHPSILTTANISANLALTAFTDNLDNKLGEGAFIIRPRDKNHVTTYGQIYNNPLFNGPNKTLPVNSSVFVPIADMLMSRDLAKSYTNIRPIASKTILVSNTTSTTSAALSGNVSAAAVSNLADLSTFTPGELADKSVTDKDYAVQIPIKESVVYTPGPEILQEFTVPVASPLPNIFAIEKPRSTTITNQASQPSASYYNDLKQIITAPIATGNDYWPIDMPRDIIGGKVDVTVRARLNTALPNVDFQVALPVGYAGKSGVTGAGPYFTNMDVGGLALGDLSEQIWNAVLDLDAIKTNTSFATNQNTSVLLPYVVFRVSQPVDISNFEELDIIITPHCYANFRSNGPLGLMLFEGVAPGQTITLTQVVAYEAVPNGNLGKDIKTSSFPWRDRDPQEITLAERVFNSRNSEIRRIYTGPMFYAIMNKFKAGVPISYAREASALSTIGNLALGMLPQAGNILASLIGGGSPRNAAGLTSRNAAGIRMSMNPYSRTRSAYYASSAANPPEPKMITMHSNNASVSPWTQNQIQPQSYVPTTRGSCVPKVYHAAGRTAAGPNITPKPMNEWGIAAGEVVQPSKQTSINEIDDYLAKINEPNAIMNVLAGIRTARLTKSKAYFPTVEQGATLAAIETIYVTDEPITSYVINDDGSTTTALTAYMEVQLRIPTASGGDLNRTIYISDDFDASYDQVATIVGMFMPDFDCYITATTPGKIAGDSYGLALVAALMGLPPLVVLTGAVVPRNYPEPSPVNAIAKLKEKTLAAYRKNMKIICPTASLFDQEGKSILSNTTAYINPTDVALGLVTNPGWILMGISTIDELPAALMTAWASINRAKATSKGLEFSPMTAVSNNAPDRELSVQEATPMVTAIMAKIRQYTSDYLDFELDPDGLLTAAEAENIINTTLAYFKRKFETTTMKIGSTDYTFDQWTESAKPFNISENQINGFFNKVFNNQLLQQGSEKYRAAPYLAKDVRQMVNDIVKTRKAPKPQGPPPKKMAVFDDVIDWQITRTKPVEVVKQVRTTRPNRAQARPQPPQEVIPPPAAQVRMQAPTPTVKRPVFTKRPLQTPAQKPSRPAVKRSLNPIDEMFAGANEVTLPDDELEY